MPHVGSGVVRIDLLHYLAIYCTRRLNQVLFVLYLIMFFFLLCCCLLGTLLYVLVFVRMSFACSG